MKRDAVEAGLESAMARAARENVRRIAGIGPAYELIEDRGEYVRVRVLHDGVEFDYRKCDAERDPPA